MKFFSLLKSFIYLLPPESAHHLAIWALKHNLIPAQKTKKHPALNCSIAGLNFSNPVGLAAGFDKNAECITNLSTQGFGFLEVGTVTPKAQSGNPKPRLFRLTKDQAIINRMGFNNVGLDKFISNFKKAQVPVGINLGKNKTTESQIDDYLIGLEKTKNLADYITINISSPNTPNLRDIQNKENLDKFIGSIMKKANELKLKTPIFLKIAPDVTKKELSDICNICLKRKINGLIISNTTITRNNIEEKYKQETGGLSGKPVFDLSNQTIKEAYKILKGKIPIIGVGGISSAEDAYTKIKLGANAVQIYSALIFQGFGLVNSINQGLLELLKKDGLNNISEAIGSENK